MYISSLSRVWWNSTVQQPLSFSVVQIPFLETDLAASHSPRRAMGMCVKLCVLVFVYLFFVLFVCMFVIEFMEVL